MPVPYSSTAIANHFIQCFGADANGIEHMKLQKLVYCSYGWMLAINGLDHPRLTNEGPQIWKFGPVFQGLYNSLKVFGRAPISTVVSSTPFMPAECIDTNDADVDQLVKWIWARYGHLTSFALSDMTHKEGTPWHRVASENDFRIDFNTAIPDQYIFEEFTRLNSFAVAPDTTGDGSNGDQRQSA